VVRHLKELLRSIRSLFRRRREEQQLDEELQFHLERQIEQNRAAGMPPEEARYAALRLFGGVQQVKEQCRDMRQAHLIETLLRDISYGLRQLRRSPGLTAVVVLSLALGIGANTAIFSLIDAVMLKLLPVKNPEQLVLLSWAVRSRPGVIPWFLRSLNGDSDQDATGRFTSTSFSHPAFEDIRARNQVFSGVLGFADAGRLNVSVDGQPGWAVGQFVSGDYFPTLGIQAFLGRTIAPADDRLSARPAAVISYGYWAQRFGRAPAVAGRTITVNGVPFILVGVTPPEFFGPQPGTAIDLWIPLHTQPQVTPGWTEPGVPKTAIFTAQDNWWVVIMGRLKQGITAHRAQAELDLIVRQNIAAIAPPPRSAGISLETPRVDLAPAGKGLNALRQQFSRPLFVLMAVVALVLFIACANVANLLLARATSRQKEVAVRLALGAGRRRLIRQLLAESVLLAAAGGILGAILAYWAGDVLLAFMSSGGEPVQLQVSPDLCVLGFTALVSVLTGILFGLAPALGGTRLDLTAALKEGAAGAFGRGHHWRGMRLGLGQALVASQVALSLLLLIGAGLFVRTLRNLSNQDMGFDHRNLLLFGIAPMRAGYQGEKLGSFYQELQQRIEALPGVRSVSLSGHRLIQGGVTINGFSLQGYTPQTGRTETDDPWHRGVHVNYVGPRFFETLGIPLLLGRTLNAGDAAKSPKVAVINSTLAHSYLGNGNPIGRRFGFGEKNNSDIAIVGVVGDAKYSELREEPPPTVYVPYAQDLDFPGAMNFEVRTAGDPKNWISSVRQTVLGLDKSLPLFDINTETEQIEQATFQERLFARLTTFFGLLALILACVGLYGVMAYAVARRTNEIGLRMALGAEREHVLWMVLGETWWLMAAGVCIGLLLALTACRLVSSMLFGLKPADPVTIATAILILVAVVTLAGYLPARRASRVDPMVALRYE
jgi:predicted permease